MAQVIVGDTSPGSADANILDITHIVASGESLVVGVLLEVTDADKEVDSVVWDQGGGDQASLSNFTSFNPSSGKLRLEVWRLTNPVDKTATVRVTIKNSNNQKICAVCVSLSNVDGTTPLEGADTEGGTGTSGSVSVTQEADDIAFIFAGHFQPDDAFGIGGGETEHEDFGLAGSFRMWAASEDGTSATTLSWTQTQSKDKSSLGFNINNAATAQNVTGAFISSGNSLASPEIKQNVVGAAIVSGSSLGAPTLTYEIAAAAIASGVALFSPTAAHRIVAATIASGVALFSPTAAHRIVAATIASALFMFAPAITTGPMIFAATVASGSSLATPILAYEIDAATLSSGLSLFAPDVNVARTDRQWLVLGYGFINEEGVEEFLVPGYGFINEDKPAITQNASLRFLRGVGR